MAIDSLSISHGHQQKSQARLRVAGNDVGRSLGSSLKMCVRKILKKARCPRCREVSAASSLCPAMSEQRLLDVTVAISFTSDYSKTDIFRTCRGVIPNRLRNARLNVDRSLNPYEYASSPTVR